MRYSRTINEACQVAKTSPEQHQRAAHPSSQISSTLAVAAAVTFTLASGATNLLYGIAKGTDLPTSIVWGAVAVATSIGLALAPAAVVASLSARRYTAALIAFVAVAIFGAYSVTAALGSATGGRMSAQNEAGDVAKTRARHQTAYDAAATELALLPAARPAAELASEVEAIDRMPGIVVDGKPCGGTLNGKVTKEWCPKRAALSAEKARAERRAELQATMATKAAELDKLPTARVANSDAQALAGYLTAFGMPVDSDTLNRALVVMAVLVIEFGGGLSLALAMALAGGPTAAPRPVQEAPASPPAPVLDQTAGELSDPHGPPQKPAKPKRLRDRRPGGSGPAGGSPGPSGGRGLPAVLTALQNGTVQGSQRSIAKALNSSKSTVLRAQRILAGDELALA